MSNVFYLMPTRAISYLLALLLLSCHATRPTQAPQQNASFPADWLGHWQGDLLIYSPKGVIDTVPMALIHEPLSDGRWKWEIIYNRGIKGKEERRAYELFTVNAENGHFCVDEKDGILLDSYVRGNVLYSRFEVMGTVLESAERIENDCLVFEIWSGSQAKIRTSGDTIIGQDTIPAVHSYPVLYMQRAYLYRR